MMKTTTFALFFFILVKYSHQKSTPKSDSYVAAVVEFSPNDPTSPDDSPILLNTPRYVSFIEKAAKQDTLAVETQAKVTFNGALIGVNWEKNGRSVIFHNSEGNSTSFIQEHNQDYRKVTTITLSSFDKLGAEYFADVRIECNADIIVFPEAGLTSIYEPVRHKLESWTTIVPAPSANYIPCIHATIPVSETLRVISCSARDNFIYVVINLAEKVICTNDTCPSDQRLYYNTNVVFDREGKIIARYRKTNLCVEPAFNITTIPEVVTFETDFGVTFGTFICFDILFKKPAMYLTRIQNITDIVYPTAWFSEVPFLTALQVQAGWSYAEDANVLVAGYSRPKFGNSGSGIYLGRQGIAKAIIPRSKTNEMLIAVVPKKNLSSSYHRSRPRYDYNLDEATVPIDEEIHYVHDELRRRRSNLNETLLHEKLQRSKRNDQQQRDSSATSVKTNDEKYLSILNDGLASYKSYQFNSSITRYICDGDFCCTFNVRMSGVDDRDHKYRMVIYDGTKTFLEPVTIGLRVCSIVLCSNESLASCGNLEKSDVIFDVLTINATFPNYEDMLIMPSSIGEDLIPIENWKYEEHWDEKKLHVSANLHEPTRNIVTCGIYGRDFSRDTREDLKDTNIGMQWATLTALAIVSLFLLFLYRKGWRKPWQRDNQLSSDIGPYRQLQTR